MISLNKNLLILLVLTYCYTNLFAQNNDKKALELKNYFWKESGNDFKVTEVPEKWMEKPAVIIARSFEKHYKKRRIGGLEYFDYEHYRIKIQSKKSLEDYAEFSFPESTTFVGYGIKFYAGYKIIKPDGREIEVSLDDAVVSEMKVNRYELNMLKLAIPNLEIGDIVDFYIAEEQHIPPVDNYYSFDPSINVLMATYPIMKQKISFNVERKCYLNVKSLNGAPAFVLQKKDDNDVYVLEDENRENYEDSKWMHPYLQLPTVKFKAVFAKGAITYSPLFLGKQGQLKNEVTEKEVVDFVNAYLNDYSASGIYLYKQVKKSLKGRTDKAEMIAIKILDEFIIGDLDNYTTFGEYPYMLEGTDVYSFKGKSLVKVESFPISSAKDNNYTKELNFTINDLDNDDSTVEIKNTISGHQKEDYIFQLVDFYDYKNEEATKHKMEPYGNPSKKNTHAKYLQKKEEYLEEMNENRLNFLEELTKADYDLEIKEVKDFAIISNGRHHTQPTFEFNYKALIEGAVKKAGNNYLISIGKLLDKQLQLEKKDLVRDYDIYLSYPRSYNYKIVFNIPLGYDIEGIENLNVTAITDFGGFTSTAKITNNQLIVKAQKYYTTNFVEQQNWETMQSFIKAAEDFNTKNVLLKAN